MLEHRLGFPLFTRTRNGVKLTPAGADFIKNALPGALELDRAAQMAAAVHRGERADLKVGVLAPLARGPLHEALRMFRLRFPDIRVTLKEGDLLDTLRAVAMGELDVCFVTGCHDFEGYCSKSLWSESSYVAFPEGHALAQKSSVSWADMRSETFLVGRNDAGQKYHACLLEKLSKMGHKPRVEFHDVSGGSLLDLVAIGYGIAVMSNFAFRSAIEGVTFLPIDGEAEAIRSSVIWTVDSDKPSVARFLDYVEKAASKLE